MLRPRRTIPVSVLVAITIAVVCGIGLSAAHGLWGFQGIGDGSVYEVAGDGSRVVGRVGANAGFWDASGGWTDLGFTGFAYGISGDGSAITGWSGASTNQIGDNRGFLWTQAGGLEWLVSLPGGGDGCKPMSISFDGTTIVGDATSDNSYREAFRWTRETGMVSLYDDLNQTYRSRAEDVSGDGFLVVGSMEHSFANLTDGWIHEADGTVIYMEDTPGSVGDMGPDGISADGTKVVGGRWYWTAGTGVQPLPVLPGAEGVSARDVSADGSIVAGYAYVDGTQTATVWDSSHGMRVLKDVLEQDYGMDLAGWHLRRAYVSEDGLTFAGTGSFNEDDQAWVAHIPEPATLGLLTLGGLALLKRRRG